MEQQTIKQKEYYIIDILKFVFSILIICLHVPRENQYILSIVAEYISRLGVPFFFTVSGFFGYKKITEIGGKNYYRKESKRLLILFGIWTAIYFPLTFYYQMSTANGNLFKGILSFLWQNVVLAPAFMWYLVALTLGLFAFSKIVKDGPSLFKYALGALIFYIIGVVLNSWRTIYGIDSSSWFYKVFQTSRNAVFFTPIFLAIGAWIAHIEVKFYQIRKHILVNFLELLFLILTYLLFVVEVTWVHSKVATTEDCSMYFSLPLVIFAICLIAFREKSYPKHSLAYKNLKSLRSMSVMIYCSQYGFLYIFTKIFGFLGKVNGFALVGCSAISACLLWWVANKIKNTRRNKSAG